MDSAFDGRNCGVEDFGDLLVRQALELAQHERGALLWREGGEFARDSVQALTLLGHGGGVTVVCGLAVVEHGGVTAGGEHVERAAGHDAIEPGPDGALLAEASECLPG